MLGWVVMEASREGDHIYSCNEEILLRAGLQSRGETSSGSTPVRVSLPVGLVPQGELPHRLACHAQGLAFASFVRPYLLSCACSEELSVGLGTRPTLTSMSSSSPDWCMPRRMSHPPMNSPFRYSCGIVGHELRDVTR